MISLGTPPGTSSHSTACSRHTTWVRARPRSRCRLDHTFSTAAWSSGLTCRHAGRAQRRDRHRAGIVRVVLVHCPRRPAAAPGRRAWAAHPAPARRRRPAAGPAGAPGPRRPRPPRSAPARPRPTPAAAPPGPREARTRSWPSGSSAAPIATAVCEPLCGSTPIITAAIEPPLSRSTQVRPRRACLIPGSVALAPLSSHATARPRQAGTSFESQATSGRQADREPAHRDLSTLRPGSLPSRPGPHHLPQVSIGRLRVRGTGAFALSAVVAQALIAPVTG